MDLGVVNNEWNWVERGVNARGEKDINSGFESDPEREKKSLFICIWESWYLSQV